MKMTSEKRSRIEKIIERFVSNVHRLSELNADKIVVNPFLAAALGLREKPEILDFFLTQRMQRGIVTSFGTTIQKIAKTLDSEAKEEDVDLVFIKRSKKYYVQLKSGPEGFTRPALRKTKATFRKLKRRDPSCVTVIGFSYGTKEQLSPIWGREAYKSADRVLVGKKFWDFFAGKGFYDELIKVFQMSRPATGRRRQSKRSTFRQIHRQLYRRLLPLF